MELMDYAFYKAMNKNGGGGSGGGSGGTTSKDVNFIDYDGTIVYSYTAAEFAKLTVMPDNLSHDGLTAQGWNWSLSDAQSYVADYGFLTVGQMYITSDGKTRIYIRLEEGRLKPYLGLAVNGTATVDWGDGTVTNTVTGSSTTTVVNTQHTYATAGDYVIAISVNGEVAIIGNNTSSIGSCLLWNNTSVANQNRVYQNAIKKIEIGSHVKIGMYAFQSCGCLTTITIPDSITSIGNNMFQNCYALMTIIIPDSVTSIGNNVFQSCYALTTIILPDSITSLGSGVFQNCYALMTIIIPDSVTRIGSAEFSSCRGLASITIPNGITSIEPSAFYSCYGLGFIKFTKTTPPIVSASNTWTNIPIDCKIYVPSGSLAAYTSATNYPSSSTYTYVEY